MLSQGRESGKPFAQAPVSLEWGSLETGRQDPETLWHPVLMRQWPAECGESWERGALPLLTVPSSLQDDVQQLKNMLGCELQAMLCVPVISRATDQVVALACAFNKLGGHS